MSSTTYKIKGWMNDPPFNVDVADGIVVRVYSLRLRWIQGCKWEKERSFLEAKGCTITALPQGDSHVLHPRDKKDSTGERE